MSQKFEKYRVICINLKSHNKERLFSISEKYNISFEVLLQMKRDGFTKIWVESGGDFVIACMHKCYPGSFIVKYNYRPMTQKDEDFLRKIIPVKAPEMPNKLEKNSFLNSAESVKKPRLPKNKLPEVLDLDAILDKIGQSGMESLTRNENEFLNNYSKNL